MALCLTAVFAYSQVWTAQDSLHLKKLLESDQELHLNMDAVKSIDFGTAVGTPRMSEEKSWMMPDESLPEALPKPKVVLSLMPYKANTRYNWDPIYQKKIKIDKNTWRGDPFYEIRHQRSYSCQWNDGEHGSDGRTYSLVWWERSVYQWRNGRWT